LLGVKGVASRQKCWAIVHYALPAIPSVLYFSVQGPLTVLLIAIFGRTAGVASVGALSRLGQLFILFAQMNGIFVEPYFASLPKPRLKSHYLGALAASGGFGLFMIGLARIFPQAFLWILGPKYAGLRFEVLLVIVSGSIGLVGGMMATVNGARRFVYHWENVSRNCICLLLQIAFIWKVDMSQVRNVLLLPIAVSVVCLAGQTAASLYGFIRGPRRVKGLEDRTEYQGLEPNKDTFVM
jgi:hypothetical protein